jgi:hypothetical protein
MVRNPQPPTQTWRTFLNNHIFQLASVDFFTVHTVWFEILFVFIVLGHGLRSSCLIHQVKPAYPSQAKAAHIVGNVIMSVRLDENGYMKDVMVIEGHSLLIQPAIDAVRS